MIADSRHAVLLGGKEIGVLHQRGDHVRFSFLPGYWEDPDRQVLGLWFEDYPGREIRSALRLPAWFANLLPEGRLRELIAAERGVSPERDMELLAQVGHDLPGAVQVVDGKVTDGRGAAVPWPSPLVADRDAGLILPDGPIKFSLAGVGLKLSMQREGDRFTVPASGESGHWIVKLPDPVHAHVPRNEFLMMSLAGAVGIQVPDVHLVHRDETTRIPAGFWPRGEAYAYAVRRFDRADDGRRIHIEDFAQVRGFQAKDKYHGSFETVAALCYRGIDSSSLQEFVRRMVFNIVIGNGDAHLKNWSLIYPDGRRPRLAPAYDLVSTVTLLDDDDLGLRFGRSRRFEDVTQRVFQRLEGKLAVPGGSLTSVASETVRRLAEAWASAVVPPELRAVKQWIDRSTTHALAVFAGPGG